VCVCVCVCVCARACVRVRVGARPPPQHHQSELELAYRTHRYGNRVRSMLATFMLGMLTQRVFMLDWYRPHDWELISAYHFLSSLMFACYTMCRVFCLL
jgi:hypothetical protein